MGLMDDRVCIITGAGGSIGLASAKLLADLQPVVAGAGQDHRLGAQRLGHGNAEQADPASGGGLIIVDGSPTDADRARAIERYLLTHGNYTDTPPSLDAGSERELGVTMDDGTIQIRDSVTGTLLQTLSGT